MSQMDCGEKCIVGYNSISIWKGIVNGYGYRNDDYFFTLVRYISIPSNYMLIPRKV